MSDKRLGANPLDWVATGTPDDQGSSPLSKGQDAATAQVVLAETETPEKMQGDFISIPESINEEDLMSRGKVKIKQTMDTAQAVAHLEDLAKSLSAGAIKAEDGDNSVVLHAADTVKFEMKLSRKKDKAKCSIEMEWHDDGDRMEGFRISG